MITSKQFEQTKIGDLVKLEDVFFKDSGLSLDESNYLGLVVQRVYHLPDASVTAEDRPAAG